MIGQPGDADEWVEVGRIGPPHGVRGEMKVQALTDFPEDRLATAGPRCACWLAQRSPSPWALQVWLVKLAEVESPEEAALLRGHTLLIPASARQSLEDEDEFYVQDLVGLRVFLQATGEEVGLVSDVFDGTGTHDAAEAEAEGGAAVPRHVLLPFAKAMVPVVDLAARRMEVTPPEGLLELVAPSNQRRARKENRGRRERRRTRPRGQSATGAADALGSDGSSPAE
ncbi:hypothetical protein CHLNCDRAFT_25138 [Chlorella variabilis]|uniref:RimM N-terminal domain-containing protein n=1 Tax=Chlorella variabilis TaxID=554065 RepID=E1ZIA8_CHLVA|nr:hypothetical protein CHLNCDRAFT_25138 [Chlorella variabilis]EFN54123.1 hypothetical protein CHLNCDRAFT_25138 [Chlorella variabilis]|eukprot:XP_005846225.1 hypothetical protein CHLNCDRAFT_25138 [Chlorella variabilis]